MAQMTLKAQWTITLDQKEMRLLVKALLGKLHAADADEAKALLDAMTQQRLAAMREQVEYLEKHGKQEQPEPDAGGGAY